MGKTILTKNQQTILSFLSKDTSFQKHFYLTGGTALSEYYLKHRLSEDLDFFSSDEIDKQWLTSLVTRIKKHILFKEAGRREIYNRNLIFFNLKGGIVKTEFTYFPSPQIEIPRKINNIPIDSLIDIAVNKFFTIYQKPYARHFIDIFILVTQKGLDWKKLQKLARIKFDTNIDPIQLGSRLIQAENISDLPKMLIKLREKDWRNFFIQKAKELKILIQK